MALPSFAPENVKPAPTSALARAFARIKSALAERHDSRLAQFVAGKVFLVRVGSALLALVSQVLLARWMGSFEFGICAIRPGFGKIHGTLHQSTVDFHLAKHVGT